ncbi:MAG: bifunctional demethylmenaquinone methyltransferase/2-methoxy-6-polyprenyl-1,4-benzoquinol methylase UbiE [Bacteroidetes bacterium]|nr:bifunctional demethylmenaquinone methyltransferase/2-methoxy-6-polyprenyl-1,4-benzoquinol methylase UbiE [Bacteroidota bacterium]
MAKSLPHDHITPFGEETAKKEQVERMFDKLAGRYDMMNRVLSAGIDIGWRKKAIGLLKKEQPQSILDVACGTGDMAIMAAHMLKPKRITGIDISEQMLAVGKNKIEKEGLASVIELQKGDSETINFPHNSFDAITVAFGVRNFQTLENGIREMLRVLKPGGRLIVLEFSKPKNAAIRKLYNLYMGKVAPQMAGLFSQDKKAYKYLNESAKAFPDRQLFVDILNKTGYSDTSYKTLSLGICCIYSGRKPL